MSNLVDQKAEAKRRAVIASFQEFVQNQPQVLPEMKHHFSKNVYAREMTMAKDTLVVGKIHKFENLNILSKGKALVVSFDGAKVVEAPHTFVAKPGAKRIIVALEDLVWTNIHGTSETDLEKIEEEFITKNYEAVLTIEEMNLLTEALYELGSNRNGGSGSINELHERASTEEKQSSAS